MTRKTSFLSDPDHARSAWRHYRRLMGWMTLAAILAVTGALLYLKATLGSLPLGMVLATTAGVGLSVLLAAALMGLIFLSSGTGHDEDVIEFEQDRH